MIELNSPKKNGSWIFWACFLTALSLAVGAAFFYFHPRQHRKTSSSLVTPEAAEEAADGKKLEKIQEEMAHISMALEQAEDLRDKKAYMQALARAAGKNIEADEIWEKWQEKDASAKGLKEGMEHALFEKYARPFTSVEKFEMLSSQYNLPQETLRTLKSEMEIMFAEEFEEKFRPSGDKDQQPAAEPKQ